VKRESRTLTRREVLRLGAGALAGAYALGSPIDFASAAGSSITVNGVQLYYKETRSKTTRAHEPLVLVHGTGFNAEAWEYVLDSFGQSYRTIAYDRRAYSRSGGSPPPPVGYHEQHADDLAALLRSLGAAPATILGWSAGGFTALFVALKHPDVVDRILLYETPLYVLSYAIKDQQVDVLTAFTEIQLQRSLGEEEVGAEKFARLVLTYSDGRNSFDTLPKNIHEGLAQDATTMYAELDAGTGEELTPETLRTIEVPIALLLGGESHHIFGEATDRVANIFPDAPLVTMPEANHIAQVDLPGVFVSAANEVLNRL
jgi:pimeloyl-ACP methyl ester carboxylesterase